MEIEENENLEDNDKEFRDGLKDRNIINDDNLNENPPNAYNPSQFQTELLINYFQDKKIFKRIVNCPKCGQQCKMVKDIQRIDNYVWRCRSNNPIHDIKINLRAESQLEVCRYNIQIIYFLLFYCFTEKKSINSAMTECEEFAKKI